MFCKVAEQSSKQSETWDTSISPVRQQTDTNTHESLEDVRHCCYCNRAHGPCQCPAWGKICASCNKKKICLGLVAEQEREFKRYSGTMTFRFVHWASGKCRIINKTRQGACSMDRHILKLPYCNVCARYPHLGRCLSYKRLLSRHILLNFRDFPKVLTPKASMALDNKQSFRQQSPTLNL